MTTSEMCSSCVHCFYCAAAYRKDHLCGNYNESKTHKQHPIKEETSHETKEKTTGSTDF